MAGATAGGRLLNWKVDLALDADAPDEKRMDRQFDGTEKAAELIKDSK